ncbi:MAG: HAD-IIIA family hydrolase [Candidatus Obscuribacterales bacterium]|nr:HAD-IIIA family hydrolase [Candidatus Obscuribacterales bacterium]
MSAKPKRRAVFLDRDGVINKGANVNKPSELQVFPFAADSISRLKQAGFLVVVVSNQGGLGENLEGKVIWRGAPMKRSELEAVHKKMQDLLGPAGSPDLIKFCPHAQTCKCSCRKPKPGMLKEAAETLNIDLKNSFMIGDRSTDVEAGTAAGATSILVLTGLEPEEKGKCPVGTLVLPSLQEAADLIILRNKR